MPTLCLPSPGSGGGEVGQAARRLQDLRLAGADAIPTMAYLLWHTCYGPALRPPTHRLSSAHVQSAHCVPCGALTRSSRLAGALPEHTSPAAQVRAPRRRAPPRPRYALVALPLTHAHPRAPRPTVVRCTGSARLAHGGDSLVCTPLINAGSRRDSLTYSANALVPRLRLGFP